MVYGLVRLLVRLRNDRIWALRTRVCRVGGLLGLCVWLLMLQGSI